MLRSILSVVAGYVVMAAIVMAGTIAAAATMVPGGLAAMKNPPGTLPHSYLAANLLLSFVAAFVGGWLTARIAVTNPLAHGLALAALLLVMSVVSARTQEKNQPPWYSWAIAAIGVTGVLLGALGQVWSAAI